MHPSKQADRGSVFLCSPIIGYAGITDYQRCYNLVPAHESKFLEQGVGSVRCSGKNPLYSTPKPQASAIRAILEAASAPFTAFGDRTRIALELF